MGNVSPISNPSACQGAKDAGCPQPPNQITNMFFGAVGIVVAVTGWYIYSYMNTLLTASNEQDLALGGTSLTSSQMSSMRTMGIVLLVLGLVITVYSLWRILFAGRPPTAPTVPKVSFPAYTSTIPGAPLVAFQ